MATKSIQKFITFSPELYRLVSVKANQFGMSVAEYIRHLIVSDIKDAPGDIPMVDTETERNIAASLKDFKGGRYTKATTAKELKDHLANLRKQV